MKIVVGDSEKVVPLGSRGGWEFGLTLPAGGRDCCACFSDGRGGQTYADSYTYKEAVIAVIRSLCQWSQLDQAAAQEVIMGVSLYVTRDFQSIRPELAAILSKHGIEIEMAA